MSQSQRTLPAPLRHRLVAGDWSRWVKDPIDVLRWTFPIGALIYLFSGDVDGTVRLGATALFVFMARWINPPRPFDLAFVLAMGLQGWGNVAGFFETVPWYDVVVHFFLTLGVSPLFYIGLTRLRVVPDLGQRVVGHPAVGLFLVTLMLGLGFGALYEIYEWGVNHWLGASLDVSYDDTVGDLAMDAAGAAVGGLALVVWGAYGWSTSRRVTGM